MKKYFDQNFRTRFSKQTMSNQKGFQWVIEEMENEFEYPNNDIYNLNEFFSTLARYNEHIIYFIRIYEIDKEELIIKNEFVKILSSIAKFAIKDMSLNNIMKYNNYNNFTSLYLLGIIAGFVQKIKINGAYDLGMFIYYNWFELYDIKNMSKINKINIETLLNNITIFEKKRIKDVYLKNINETKISYKEKNLIGLNKYNKLFNNIGYKRNQFCTWQEDYLLQMSKISFSIKDIVPHFSTRTWKVPNYDLWNEKIIKNMKDFFLNNNDALTILEIIDFRLHNGNIGISTQKIVLDKALSNIKNKNRYYDFDNIWFYILIKLMNEKNNYINSNTNQIFIELKKKRNIQIILFLKENGLKIDREIQKKIDNYYIKQIKTIDKIENLNTFIDLIKENQIKKNINEKILVIIMDVFYNLIAKKDKNLLISNAFYYIVNFLIAAKNNVNNEIVNKYIFDVLKIWNEDYYEKAKLQMHKIESSTTVKKEQIDLYNIIFELNPLKCFRETFSWKESNILKHMSISSEFAISTILSTNTLYINDFIPYQKKIDISQKESFDNIVCRYLDEIQVKYEEQLLNSNIEPVNYLQRLYDDLSLKLSSFVLTINEDNYKKMYKDIKKSFIKYTLLPYPQKIKVAHITQLIPLLELLIRELGIKNNIIPFKEKENQIHVMKDASTILLSIIKKKYKENNDFESIGVYLFLYNYLYNINSLNIRNELIHAREYIDNENQMSFAFKTLIIGIYWGALELYQE